MSPPPIRTLVENDRNDYVDAFRTADGPDVHCTDVWMRAYVTENFTIEKYFCDMRRPREDWGKGIRGTCVNDLVINFSIFSFSIEFL